MTCRVAAPVGPLSQGTSLKWCRYAFPNSFYFYIHTDGNFRWTQCIHKILWISLCLKYCWHLQPLMINSLHTANINLLKLQVKFSFLCMKEMKNLIQNWLGNFQIVFSTKHHYTFCCCTNDSTLHTVPGYSDIYNTLQPGLHGDGTPHEHETSPTTDASLGSEWCHSPLQHQCCQETAQSSNHKSMRGRDVVLVVLLCYGYHSLNNIFYNRCLSIWWAAPVHCADPGPILIKNFLLVDTSHLPHEMLMSVLDAEQ